MYESYLSEDGKWEDIPGKGKRFVTSTGEVRRGDPNAPLAGFARGVKKFFQQPRLTPAQLRASSSGVPMSGPGSGSTPAAAKPERQGPYVPERLKKAPTDSRLDSPIAGKGPKDNQVGSSVKPIVTSTSPSQQGQGGSGVGRGVATSTSPTGGKGKVAPAPTKPAAAAQTGDKAKDMATFAKANQGLAAAAAERARTRGTSATTNPLMKDMKSRLPAPAAPKVAPSNTLSNTVAAASKPAAFSPAPEVKATNTIAAAPKLPSVAPKAPMAGRDQMLQRNLKNGMEYDAFDLVLEYLLSEGHTDTLEEALYVMMEMDPETIQSICEGYQELNYKRRNRMTDQAMRHMGKGDDKSWEKAYSIENQRDTQTPEVSKAKAAANRAKGAAKRGKG
jgi:hypothetical protein